ncbi:MAG: hypothetical protein U9O94_11795 [Nanoarchaeota archaeon]|nr:hypothetical protein [Nanoarchaeota archaeon]
MTGNYFKQYLDSFRKFKLELVIFNFLFIMFAYLGFYLMQFIVKGPMARLDEVENIAANIFGVEAAIAAFRNFFLVGAIAILVFFLLIILSYSLFEGLIWCRILKKKFTLEYFRRFTLLNLIWFFSFIIIASILLFGSKQSIVGVVLAVLAVVFILFSQILGVVFTQKNKLRAIKKTFSIGFRVHRFIIPLIFILATFLIVSQLNLLNIHFILIMIIYLVFFSWMQNYFADVIVTIS